MNAVRIRVIAVVISALSVGGCILGWQGRQPRQTHAPSLETPSPSPPPLIPAADGTPESPAVLSLDMDKALRLLEDQVSLLRGLRPSAEIPLQLLPSVDLQAMALESCEAQLSGEALLPETLAMLGLHRREVDLPSILTALTADWAAALTSRYDAQHRRIDLADPPALNPRRKLDYVASYVAALRAENLDAGGPSGCCPIVCASTSDSGLALTALFEGDRQLIQEQWVRIYGSQEDAARFAAVTDPLPRLSLSGAPQTLQETYAFVLAGGRAFVHGLYLSGGWPAVDRAYADPPSSTEQILHPDRYPEDDPLALQAPDLSEALGPTWEARQVGVLGEWWTRQTLQAFLPPDESAEASIDWGGDVLLVYHNTPLDQDLLILITRWDNLRRAQDFALAFRKYGEARFGERRPTEQGDTWTWEGGFSLLERGSDQTLWILAPNQATAEAARAGIVFPTPAR